LREFAFRCDARSFCASSDFQSDCYDEQLCQRDDGWLYGDE
jgi:hypothetical protein